MIDLPSAPVARAAERNGAPATVPVGRLDATPATSSGHREVPSSQEARDLLRQADRPLAADDPQRAIDPARAALVRAQTSGDLDLTAAAPAVLADAEWRGGDIGAATDHVADAIALRRASNDHQALGSLLDRCAELALARGDLAAATAAYDESLTITRRLLDAYGDTPQALRDLRYSLGVVASTRRAAGDEAAAAALDAEAAALAPRLTSLLDPAASADPTDG